MTNAYKKILANLSEVEPPDGLLGVILKRVNEEKKRLVKIKLIFQAGLAVLSFGILVPSSIDMVNNLSQSGFDQFFSLLFSDSAAIIPYWKEFLLLLVESLPIFSIIVLLLAIVSLLTSIKSATNNAKLLLV